MAQSHMSKSRMATFLQLEKNCLIALNLFAVGLQVVMATSHQWFNVQHPQPVGDHFWSPLSFERGQAVTIWVGLTVVTLRLAKTDKYLPFNL